jgi:negative regulator of flagellin synthesis FlgM
MKVSDSKSPSGAIQYLQQNQKLNQPDKAQNAPEGKPSHEEDRVDLSQEAKDLKKIHDALADAPEVRTEKVEALQQQVQENRYQVNSPAVADKMVRQALMDLNQ